MLDNYVAIDLEMTGLNAKTDAIVEVGAVRVRMGKAADTYEALLQCDRALPTKVTELTGITEAMVQQGRRAQEAMVEFFDFLGDDILVGHNVIFDYSFLKQWAVNHAASFERSAVDTLKLARKFLPSEQKKDLESLCTCFAVERGSSHRALDDALGAWKILEYLKKIYGEERAEEFAPQPLVYKAKKQTPATRRQKEYLEKICAHHKIVLPQSLDALTRSEASRLTDQLIAQYGKMPRP